MQTHNPPFATRWLRQNCMAKGQKGNKTMLRKGADTWSKMAPDIGSGGIFVPDKQLEATWVVTAAYITSQTGGKAAGGHCSSGHVRHHQSKQRNHHCLFITKNRHRARFPRIGTAPNSPPLLLNVAGPTPRHHPGAICPTHHQSTQTGQNWQALCPAFLPNTPPPVPA